MPMVLAGSASTCSAQRHAVASNPVTSTDDPLHCERHDGMNLIAIRFAPIYSRAMTPLARTRPAVRFHAPMLRMAGPMLSRRNC